MAAGLVLAAVAAVLAPGRVVFVDTLSGSAVRSVPLPGPGVAVFAAPDDRVVVPLRDEDATAVVSPAGQVERWPGRVFPLFSSEYDRMDVVLPGRLVTLSYPERLPLLEVPLPGVSGAVRAAVSRDGRVVAVIPPPPGDRSVVLVAAAEGGTALQLGLANRATAVVVVDDAGTAVTAGGEALEAAVLGGGKGGLPLRVGGEVLCLCHAPDSPLVLVGLGLGEGGAIVGVRVDRSSRRPLTERFRTPLPAPVVAVAAGNDGAVAISGDTMVMLARNGRRVVRSVPLPGASDVAVLPRTTKTTVPSWGDAPSR
jgi:hypothetical protein